MFSNNSFSNAVLLDFPDYYNSDGKIKSTIFSIENFTTGFKLVIVTLIKKSSMCFRRNQRPNFEILILKIPFGTFGKSWFRYTGHSQHFENSKSNTRMGTIAWMHMKCIDRYIDLVKDEIYMLLKPYTKSQLRLELDFFCHSFKMLKDHLYTNQVFVVASE